MFANFLKIIMLLYQVILNVLNGILKHFGRGNEHIGWINIQAVVFLNNTVCFNVERFNIFYFIAKKMDSDGIICIAGENINCITFNSEITMIEFAFGSGIQTLNQAMQ